MSKAIFNAESTTSDVIQGIDLNGKVAVVTGASTGLGLETARTLSAAGAQVVMVARNNEKLTKAMKTIHAEQNKAKLFPLIMDLNDQESVRTAAKSLSDDFSSIDYLINNAGVMACAFDTTVQGIESQFGCNHIGHFLFTCLVIPLLKQSEAARVISLSSAGHKIASVDLSDINFEKRGYEKWTAYGQSKSANALFALELNKRLEGSNISAFSVHPGMIMTELGRHLDEDDIKMLVGSPKKDKNIDSEDTAKDLLKAEGKSEKKSSPFKTIPQGAATSVWAATSDSLQGKGGEYLENCQIAEANIKSMNGGFADHIVDAELASALWELSEDLVNEEFQF